MKIYFISGEPSGDLLVAGLMKALRRKDPNIQFAGVGGESMAALGLNSLFNIKEIAVMGFFEVVPRLPLILKRIREVVEDIQSKQPDVIVTVDSWGFVSSVLGKLKKKGINIPKVHYVAPQVWAWKKGRAKKVAQLVDHLLTLLPNEPAYFEKHGLHCEFVGHPVIENTSDISNDQTAFRTTHGIPTDSLVISVLPGSRRSEINRMVPVFKEAIKLVAKQHPKLFVLIPTVATVAAEVEAAFSDLGVPYEVLTGQQIRYQAFKASNIALAKSGTVSLELTACRTPHLIAYTFNPFTNLLVKMFVKIKYANLINLLANTEIIPEFLAERCRGDLVGAKALELLDHADLAQLQQAEAQISLQKLRLPNILPSDRAAEVVLQAAKQ